MGLDRPALQSSRYSRCYLQCRGSTGPCYFFIWHWLGSPAFFSLTAAAAGKAVKIMHEGLSSPCSHVFFVIALATRKVRRRETGGGLGVIAAAVAAPGWGCWRKWTALSSKFDQRLLPLCFCFFFFSGFVLHPSLDSRFSGPLEKEGKRKSSVNSMKPASKWLYLLLLLLAMLFRFHYLPTATTKLNDHTTCSSWPFSLVVSP